MSDHNAGTPRVFLCRHGETEWTISGRYTGLSDIPLTPRGEQQVRGTASKLVGPKQLIDPARLIHVFISPRQRAQKTYELLFSKEARADLDTSGKVSVTEEIAEWAYGEYDGKMSGEIRAMRKDMGLDGERAWDIWRDGCEGGESPEKVTRRLDGLIAKIRKFHEGKMKGEEPADVAVVAHGHILRAFTKRWLGYSMDAPLSMMIEPGAIGILSYQHKDINWPAFLLGMGLPLED